MTLVKNRWPGLEDGPFVQKWSKYENQMIPTTLSDAQQAQVQVVTQTRQAFST